VPRAVSNEADDAVFLASAYGLTPDEWQSDVLEGWLGRRRDGKWAAATCGLAVPRQNGKNGVIEVRELFGMIGLGEKFLHTAHQVKTAKKAFKRIASFFENERQYPELAALVQEIRKTNGQEAIVLSNGGSVEFIARSSNSGRGFTVDVLVCDEAQDLTDDELEALLPTISASPSGNPQVILTGTPPDPDKGETGEVFTRVRQDGEANRDPRLAWCDFGVKDGPLPDLDDRALWEKVNPAIGVRLGVDEITRERALMSAEGFARERLGWWGEPGSGESDIDPRAWRDCANPVAVVDGPRALGLDVTLDQSWASLAGAGMASGRMHVETVSHQKGTGWIVEAAVELQAKHPGTVLVVDERSPAAALIPDLEEANVLLVKANTAHVIDGCAWMYTAIHDQQVTHADDADMNSAVAGTRKRAVGDRFAWGRKQSATDITPFNAATLAAWQVVSVGSFDVLNSVW
jgi:hypothetical protein